MRLPLMIGVLALGSACASASPPDFHPFDEAYKGRRTPARFQVALEGYRRIAGDHPDLVEAQWRLAMACTFRGLRVETDEDAIVQSYDEGRGAARRALERDPECVPCHFWRAVNQVLYASQVGVVKMLFSLKEIRAHFRFVAEHDPKFHSGAALRFLALIDWKLPGILGGDNDRARAYFERAIELGPDEAMNYETYHEFLLDRGENERASVLLERVSAIPEPADERVESRDAWDRMRDLYRLARRSTVASS